jgi:hypothetical protein
MNHLRSKIISSLVVLFFTTFPLIGLTQSDIVSDAQPSGGGAASGEYTPITPGYSAIFGGNSLGGNGFEGMLTRIFELTVYFTVILSVIMMIVGGLKYMGSESFFKKGEGKEQIFAALSGLLIALVSILIISTILPGWTGGGASGGGQFQINIFGDQ